MPLRTYIYESANAKFVVVFTFTFCETVLGISELLFKKGSESRRKYSGNSRKKRLQLRRRLSGTPELRSEDFVSGNKSVSLYAEHDLFRVRNKRLFVIYVFAMSTVCFGSFLVSQMVSGSAFRRCWDGGRRCRSPRNHCENRFRRTRTDRP